MKLTELLVIHEDPRSTLSLKRALERELSVGEVYGAGGAEVALRRVEEEAPDAVLLHWGLPEGGAYELLFRLSEWRGEGPPVLVFGREMELDDVRRVLQLGVAGVLVEPLDPAAVVQDLDALRKRGVSVSVGVLMERHGRWLLEPDELLWAAGEAGRWHRRMSSLAVSGRKSWLGDEAQRLEALAQRLEAAVGGPVTAALLQALLAVLAAGEGRLQAVAEHCEVEDQVLLRLLRRAKRFGRTLGGDEQLVEALKLLESKLADRETRRDGNLVKLRKAARTSLQRLGQDGPDPLVERLGRLLAVPVGILEGLSDARHRQLASRLLMEEDEPTALRHVRMALLAWLLRPENEALAHPDEVSALRVLMGKARGGFTEVDLLAALCELDPDPALEGLDLLALRRFAPALDGAFREVVMSLLAAGQPGGLVDRRRVRALVSAVEAVEPTLVAAPTWTSLNQVLAAPAKRKTREAIQQLLFVVGARGSRDVDPLRGLMSLLVERETKPMDVERFLQICRDAITGTLDRSAFQKPERVAAPTSTLRLTPDDYRQARLMELVDEFRSVDESLTDLHVDDVKERLPARTTHERFTEGEMLRLRMLASSLAEQNTDVERMAILRTHSPEGRPRGEEVLVLEEMARELADEKTPKLLWRLLGMGANDAQSVRAFLDQGRLDAAFVAVQRLHDGDAETGPLLNEVSIALYEADRGPESEPLLHRALRLEPDKLNILFNLARLQHELCHDEEALPLALEVCMRAPHLTPGQVLLDRIEAALLGTKA